MKPVLPSCLQSGANFIPRGQVVSIPCHSKSMGALHSLGYPSTHSREIKMMGKSNKIKRKITILSQLKAREQRKREKNRKLHSYESTLPHTGCVKILKTLVNGRNQHLINTLLKFGSIES